MSTRRSNPMVQRYGILAPCLFMVACARQPRVATREAPAAGGCDSPRVAVRVQVRLEGGQAAGEGSVVAAMLQGASVAHAVAETDVEGRATLCLDPANYAWT